VGCLYAEAAALVAATQRTETGQEKVNEMGVSCSTNLVSWSEVLNAVFIFELWHALGARSDSMNRDKHRHDRYSATVTDRSAVFCFSIRSYFRYKH
jgi:hypothetical protein